MPSSIGHKRALSSGESPITKKVLTTSKYEPPSDIYITISIKKIVHEYANDAVEEVTTNHKAYQTKEDAENALREVANKQYSHQEWTTSQTTSGGLHLMLAEDEDGYSDETGTELKVERLMLMPAGCVPKVKLRRPATADDENGSSENEDEENDDEDGDEDVGSEEQEVDEDEIIETDGSGIPLHHSDGRVKTIRA